MPRKVLISKGYGCGWATWNSDKFKFFAEDPGLIDLAEGGASEAAVESYVKSVLGENYFACLSGWRDITIETIPDDAKYRIDEYDGFESIVLQSDEVWY